MHFFFSLYRVFFASFFHRPDTSQTLPDNSDPSFLWRIHCNWRSAEIFAPSVIVKVTLTAEILAAYITVFEESFLGFFGLSRDGLIWPNRGGGHVGAVDGSSGHGHEAGVLGAHVLRNVAHEDVADLALD